MTDFEIIERPEKNRHRMRNDLNYDHDLERALLDTLMHGRAIKVGLGEFHSSPTKGRLWLKGYSVRHRVTDDKDYVAAWLETGADAEDAKEELLSQLPLL